MQRSVYAFPLILFKSPWLSTHEARRHGTHAPRSVLNVLGAKWRMSLGDYYLYYYTGALWFNSKNSSSFHMMQGDTRRQKCLKVYWSFGAAKSLMCPKWCVVQLSVIAQGSHKNCRKKFHDFSMTSPGQNQNFQTKKNQFLFLRPMYQFVESITDRHRCILTHRHTYDLIIQLILLVIELIQEVKTTLVNLIMMGNRFS